MTITREEIDCLKDGTTWRSHKLFHLPTIISSGSLPDDFYEIVVEDAECDDIFEGLKERLTPDEDDDQERYERWEEEERALDYFLSEGRLCSGFLALIECPIFNRTPSGSLSFSWGHYQMKYVHVHSIEQLVMEGNKLEKEVRERAEKEKSDA